MRNSRNIATFFSLFAILPVATAVFGQDGTAGLRALTIEDISAVKSPGGPRIAPGGQRIAYTLDSRIYIVDDGATRPVTSAALSAWDPYWSADGRSLYFLSDRSGETQLWRLPVGTFGEAERITDFEHGVASLNLSPDESRLLLSFTDKDFRDEPESDEPVPFVVTRRHFKRDAGEGYITEGQERHLYVYDIEAGSLSQITSGEFNETGAAWSPDGGSVVFVSNRENPDETYTNDLWIVAADNSDKGKALTRLTDNADSKHSPAWSPDGERIAYLTAVDGVYGQQNVAVVSADGGEPVVVTGALDRWVSSFEFSDDGRWIYFNFASSGASHLARVRLRDSRIEKLVEGERNVSAFDVAPNGDIALRVNGRDDAADIYRFDGRRLARQTDSNRKFFDEVALGSKSHVSFNSSDGTEVEAFITTPPGYIEGRAYPAILNIHGGPVGQFRWGYSFGTQFYAANGYVVIEPNPRGSNGRGQDFINAIFAIWGEPDYEDVVAAVDYAVAEGIADPERLAVTGYSYGGYLTNVAITQTDRFKAAASGAGHSLIEANIGHDIYQKWYYWELGLPWENHDKYAVVSPLLRAGNVTTPTIFLGGRIDWNVPILNAELFYQALKVQGIDSTLVVYPGAHHGGWPEAFEKDYLVRIVDWFDKYLAVD